jgi:DNA polymerase-3 subunit gamma/tau
MTPESVQLAYQIVAQGRADLAIAPDESTGFAMTLLRLLAFEPASPDGAAGGRPTVARGSGDATSRADAAAPPRAAPASGPSRGMGDAARATVAYRPAAAPSATASQDAGSPAAASSLRPLPADPAAWPDYVAGLDLSGMAAQLAAQAELRAVEGNVVNLRLPATHKHLADRAYSDKLKAALERAAGRRLMLAFEVGDAAPASLASKERREREQARERGEAAFRDDPFVQEVVARFDGRVRPETIKPLPAAEETKR